MNTLIKICAWCKKRLDGSTEPVDYDGPNISHGMCTECFEKELQQCPNYHQNEPNVKPALEPDAVAEAKNVIHVTEPESFS